MNDNHYLLMNIPESKQFDFLAGSFFALNELNKKLLNINDVDEIKNNVRDELRIIRKKLNDIMINDFNAFKED